MVLMVLRMVLMVLLARKLARKKTPASRAKKNCIPEFRFSLIETGCSGGFFLLYRTK
jgi:hypothetical protein